MRVDRLEWCERAVLCATPSTQSSIHVTLQPASSSSHHNVAIVLGANLNDAQFSRLKIFFSNEI